MLNSLCSISRLDLKRKEFIRLKGSSLTILNRLALERMVQD